jgi:gliding motility-associated-like protein
MKKYYIPLFLFLFLCVTSYVSYGQSDCSTTIPICTDANSGGVVNGYGNDDFNGQTVSGCLRNGLGVNTIETNSFWFRVKLAESGEFGFNIIPNDLSEDWDFAVYGPNPSCGALGTPIACNYSKVSATGYTGVGLDPNTNTQTDAYYSWMNVTAGQEYVVFINQYAGNNAGFSIEWEGAVMEDNTDPLDCDILVNLGPDRELCSGQSTILNATTFGTTISYQWLLFNSATGVFEPIIPVQNTATLLVDTTGNYQVIVTNASTGEILDDDIVVTIHDTPIATSPAIGIVLCDTDNDGLEDFYLESKTYEIENGQTNVMVTYHESEIFARAGAAPQSSPYSSGNTTIWARIENSANTICYDVTSFDLMVTPSPNIIKPPDLQACDNDTDGFTIFNLDDQTPIVLNGQTLDITYYEDEANANDYKGWIVNTSIYPSDTRTIWVRVGVVAGSNCYALTSFDIEVLELAIANTATDLQQCDDNNDGVYEFDLNALKDAEILGAQDPATFEINYFATQAHADANTPILTQPYENVTPYAIETIWARIQNSSFSECYNTTSFSLQVFDSAFPLDASEIPILSYCDDLSDGDETNGFYEFDLTERESEILDGQSPFVFDVDYYEDALYTIQINNPQTYTNSIQNGQRIYVRLTNSNPNNIDCYTDTSFEIEVSPLPNALQTSYEFRQCDEDGTYDGITDFNLEEADTYVALGNTTLNVSYYLSPIDAASGTNPQTKYPFSNSVSSTIYARVESENYCYRIVIVDLIVSSTTFPPNYNRELITCDDETIDGLHVFNLTQYTSEIISLFGVQNLRVGYYRNREGALSELNEINSSNAYLSEVPFNQTIWVRVESSTDGGCFGIAPVIQLTVNPRPEFELDDTAILCLNNSPLNVSTYNPSGNYTYEWTDESGTIISQQPGAEIINGGTYSVVATSVLGCESFVQQTVVTESNIADIYPDDVQINDNSSNNSITIITENQNLGIGDYEFALDDSNGIYQDSPTFTSVLPGEHTVYVRDKNDCGTTQVTIYVLGFPRFFTPNNDGENDTWRVLGVNSTIFPESTISIYDRYGKVMTNFEAIQGGWDGSYIDHLAPSSDYWYKAQLVDVNGNILVYNGHFSLIRR